VFLTTAADASALPPPPTPRMQPLDVDMSAVSPLKLDKDTLGSLVVDSASAWLPFVLRFLSFRSICRVAATCKVWRALVLSCDPGVLVPHLEVAVRRHLAENGRGATTPINGSGGIGGTADEDAMLRSESRRLSVGICLATGGNATLLMQMRIIHELERRCRHRPHGSAYSTFLRKVVPIARSYALLCDFVPAFFRNLSSSVRWLDVTCCWQQNVDLADVARFSIALACTLGSLCNDTELRNTISPPGRPPLRLRVLYAKQGDFGLFMDPLQNTVHCASLDTAFLTEQLRNACRSLSRFDEICGYCADLPALESRVSQLLGLRGVQRDPELSESSHAHCLFKLALYHGEINGGLRGTIIRPSRAFESVPGPEGLVVSFLWCASWLGRGGTSRASNGSSSSNNSDAQRNPPFGTPADDDDDDDGVDDDDDGDDCSSTAAEDDVGTDAD